MAEPQYLFAEIPLSRSAFERWLKSSPCPATLWPEWADADIPGEEKAATVLDALIPFFIAEPELQQCLLLHDKQMGVLRCALWLRYEEMRPSMMQMLALLRGTAPFMATKVQGLVQHGENCCGTLTLTRDNSFWHPECKSLSFPQWSEAWLLSPGEESNEQWMDAKLCNALKRRYNHYLLHATPERPVAIKKTEYYSNGREVVDCYGNCIKGADPLTFKRLCHTYFCTLYTDGKAVWIDSGLLGLCRHKIADNLTPERIQVMEGEVDSYLLVRIDDRVWFRTQDRIPEPFYLTSLIIDPDSFHRLTYSEYADKNAVYRYEDNPGLKVVKELGPEDIVRIVGSFIITESSVLCDGEILPLADSNSFRSLGHGFYCDDHHVWLRCNLLEKLDPQTFRFVAPEHRLVADKYHVYGGVCWISDADAQTLEVLTRGSFLFWRDLRNIWYGPGHVKCEGADVTQGDIEIYPESVFCRVGDRIWGMATELKDVDVASFVVTDWDSAEDKYGCFYRDGRIE